MFHVCTRNVNCVRYLSKKEEKWWKGTKKHKKAEYSILFINRELNKHLKEVQEQAQKEIDFIIKDLKSKSDLTEDMKNTNPLYWVGTMNSIKNQAE